MEEDKSLNIRINANTQQMIISLIVLTMMCLTMWYMRNIVLLTFVITFLFYQLLRVVKGLNRRFFSFDVPDGLIITVLYGLVIFAFIIAVSEFVPRLTEQVLLIAEFFKKFDINAVKASLDPRLASMIAKVDVNKYIYDIGSVIGTWAGTVGGFGLNLFLSMLLSFFLLIEKKKIRHFGEQLERSKMAFIYRYIVTFGANFVHTFAKVMKVQVLIAIINSIFSMIFLSIMGFNQIAVLGLMIFALGLIPVAGVAISLIPLSIIAFSIGGITKVIEVIIMVLVIHVLEAYVLNPKLMSSKTELPVCFVFIILLVGEHYIGVWGLLIGVPVFIFLMNVLHVDYADGNKKKKKSDRKAETAEKNGGDFTS